LSARALRRGRDDPAQQVDPRRRVAHVEPMGARRRLGGAVGVGQHQVDPDHLVGRPQGPVDGAADEAGGAGEQNLHGIS